MPRFDPFKEVEGYAQAVYSERLLRDSAFIDGTRTICGVEIAPLTAEKLLILDACDCPFLFEEKDVTAWPEQIIQALWILSPQFVAKRGAWQSVRKFLFARKHRSINYSEACVALFKWKEETFYDSPGRGKGTSKSYYSWIASIVDSIASEYGWPRNQIKKEIPLTEIFQLLRCIQSRKSTEPLSNKSERKISEHLAKLNEGKVRDPNAKKILKKRK